MSLTSQNKKAGRTALKIALIIPVMFAFAVVVMPPLYDIACKYLGINGKGINTGSSEAMTLDKSRQINVEFIANVYEGTSMSFTAPQPRKLKVHPGELVQVSYQAQNLAKEDILAQAVHSISPGYAAKHINLMECFCFQKQEYRAGETRELPLAFTISPELPKDISTLSISYTFFMLDPEGVISQ